jgi:hemerythrin superfamily protein
MLSEPSRRLEDDHHSLGELLSRFQTTIANRDVKTAHAALDLFWARLAVHIRAEHLHLFPSILNASTDTGDLAGGPSMRQAQATINALVDDHDFFMRELSSAISVLREALTLDDRSNVEEKLTQTSQTVARVAERLQTHNQTEEETIYRWVVSLLDEERQSRLDREVQDSLLKLPARFNSASGQTR